MIGIFGGSFDPVHYGHLNNATSLKQALDLSELYLMPCANPVHKDGLTFSNTERLKMLELACEPLNLRIDTREMDRQGDSYTIDSLIDIAKDHPSETLCLIIGADSFLQLDTWKDYQAFHQYCHLVVIERPESPLTHRADFGFTLAESAEQLKQQPTGLVWFDQGEMLDISSSEIRGKIARGEDLSDLLPASVINHLQQK